VWLCVCGSVCGVCVVYVIVWVCVVFVSVMCGLCVCVRMCA